MIPQTQPQRDDFPTVHFEPMGSAVVFVTQFNVETDSRLAPAETTTMQRRVARAASPRRGTAACRTRQADVDCVDLLSTRG